MAFYKIGEKVRTTKTDDAYHQFVKGEIVIITGAFPVSNVKDGLNSIFYTINTCSNNSYFGESYFEALDEGYYYGFLTYDA